MAGTEALPPEVLTVVWGGCDLPTLASCAAVCRAWRAGLRDEHWERAALSRFAFLLRRRPSQWSGRELAERLAKAARPWRVAAEETEGVDNQVVLFGGCMSPFRDFCSSEVVSFGAGRLARPTPVAGRQSWEWFRSEAEAPVELPAFLHGKPSLPHTLSAVGYARSRDNELLAVGGWDGREAHAHHLVLPWDGGRRGLWREEAPMRQARCFHAFAVADEGYAIAMGGGSSVWQGAEVFADCEIYRPGHHQNLGANPDGAFQIGLEPDDDYPWRPFPALRFPRCGAVAATLPGGSVFVVGGYGGASTYHASAEVLRPGAAAWERLPDMQVPRTGFGLCGGADSALYAVGGSPDGQRCHRSVERLDPREPSWTPVASLHEPRAYCAATITPQGLIFVAGGETEVHNGGGAATGHGVAETLQTVEVLDTRKLGQTWVSFMEVHRAPASAEASSRRVHTPWRERFEGILEPLGKLDNALVYML